MPGWQERSAYIDQLGQQIAATPGVLAVGSGTAPPNSSFETEFSVTGRPTSQKQKTRMDLVSSNYFSMLHIPTLRGRMWSEAEDRQALPLAVVNETFAKRFLSGSDPVGQQIALRIIDGTRKEISTPGSSPPSRLSRNYREFGADRRCRRRLNQ